VTSLLRLGELGVVFVDNNIEAEQVDEALSDLFGQAGEDVHTLPTGGRSAMPARDGVLAFMRASKDDGRCVSVLIDVCLCEGHAAGEWSCRLTSCPTALTRRSRSSS